MPTGGLRIVLVAWSRALLVAVAAVAVAGGVRVLLGLVLPTDLSFTAMLPAVVVAALAGGLGSGVLAAVLGGVVAQWAFVPPYYEFAVPTFADVGNLIVYWILCVIVLWAAGLYARERRRAEANAAAAARLASIVTNSADAIIGFDRNGVVGDWNKAAERLFGYAADEIVGRPVAVLFPAERSAASSTLLSTLLAKESAQFSGVWVAKDGRGIDVTGTTGPVHLADGAWIGVAAVVHDVRREVASERALREAHRRNVALLGETHQRARNTLQAVAGLIGSCARQVGTEPARRQIGALEQRVGAMARIHDHLHRTAEFGIVEIGGLLRQIVGDLVGSAGRPATMEIIGGTEVQLRSDLAVPVILAISELVTIALTDGRSGRATVQVRYGEETGALVIVVTDNGSGLPPDLGAARELGVGLRMAGDAVEQLGGTLRALPRTEGTAFEIRVPLAPTDGTPTAPR
jgi:PAS domain S-box-containing protein